MAKIITVTANTAIDNIIEIDTFTFGGVVRARTNTLFPAGKGLNVARIVAALGKEVVALGFVGEESAPLFAELEKFKIRIRLQRVLGFTRTNLTLVDSNRRLISHIQTSSGYQVTANHLEALEKTLRQEMTGEDVVVLSGSLPQGVPADTYNNLIEIVQDRGARIILDSEGANLRLALNTRPFMIKPNLRELSEMLDLSRKLEEQDIIGAAKTLGSRGISLVVISRGPDGVIVSWDKGTRAIKARIDLKHMDIPNVVIGSGDALVGGFAVGILEGRELHDQIRLAVACAAANLLSLGPGVVDLKNINALIPTVELVEIS